MHRLAFAVLLVSSIAHADVDVVGGYASMTTSLDQASDAQNTGPMLAADAGVHVTPWLSLLGFVTYAFYRNSDNVDGSRRVTTLSMGPAVRFHWGNAFAGIGGGLGVWHASFDDYGVPNPTDGGAMVRLELGFQSEPSHRGWRAMVAGRLSRGWYPTAPADSFESMSGTTTTFEVVAGVAL